MKRSSLAVFVVAVIGVFAWAAAESPATLDAPQGTRGVSLIDVGESTRPGKNVELAGAVWLGSFDMAKKEAREAGKPILHLQMFGALDDAMC
jgi:hypothetical protein